MIDIEMHVKISIAGRGRSAGRQGDREYDAGDVDGLLVEAMRQGPRGQRARHEAEDRSEEDRLYVTPR